MKLVNCYIENFGKLSNFKLNLSDGLNTIKEENGYGKTTLTVFIKAMFYGLDATKRQKLEYNDRKHYMPWQGGRCGGSLTFSVGDRSYRIERTFASRAADDTFALYDAKTGNTSTDYSENLGEELFLIDADGFERTVFLSEANLSGKNENKSISAKLSDLVGCDGDLSVMDEAIDLLEKQRKVYYKRGGSGEIGDLKEKLGATERDIADLIRLEDNYKEEKAKLASSNARLAELREQKKKGDEQRLKSTYRKQYAEMKLAYEKEKADKDDHARFFASGIPTEQEINAARECYMRAKQIDSSRAEDSVGKENKASPFSRLDIKESDYECAKEAATLLAKKESEKAILDRQIAAFAPVDDYKITTEEVDFQISALKELKNNDNANNNWQIPMFSAIGCLIVGVVLGLLVSPLAFLVSALALVLFPIAIKAKSATRAKKSDNEAISGARALLDKVYSSPYPDSQITELLYEVRGRLVERERKSAELAQTRARVSELSEEIAAIEREACEFISRFEPTGCITVREAIEHILKEKEIYDALLKSNEAAEIKRREQLLQAEEYKKRYTEFLSRYPYTTSYPFDEIATKLAEYNSLCRSSARMEEAIRDFAVLHGIDESAEGESEQIIDTLTLAAEIAELERTATITERQCTVIREALDGKDELLAEAEELRERISEYERKLDIIQKTKAYLGEAKDILTSKYLSKTKSAFDKYVKLIGNESGDDFSMNTSFAVMKEEHGSLKESDAYSRGMRDLYALATRLALIDSLYENELPFIILDDPFAYFDDEKLACAVKALKAIAKEKQILYLTCTKARSI